MAIEQLPDLYGRQRTVIKPKLIERPLFQSRRAKERAKTEAVAAILGTLVQMVSDYFGGAELAIDEQLQSLRLAGAIATRGDLHPLLGWNGFARANGEGITGPEAFDHEKEPALIQIKLGSVETDIG